MSFSHPLVLIAIAATLVPIILHLLNRRSAKLLDWGAMQFLLGSLISRRRRVLLEEMMLLAMRCLLFTLAALVVAGPQVKEDSKIPWMLVLPALLLGTVALGVGTAFWQERVWRWRLWAAGCLMLLVAAIAILNEEKFQLRKHLGSDRDVAIVIDASSTMNLKVDGISNFQRAVQEARTYVAGLGDSATLTVILAGAVPQVVTDPGRPLMHRDEMDKLLAGLKPLGGSSALRPAIQRAAQQLRDAFHPAKQIVVFSDQQKEGWSVDDAPAWQETAAELKGARYAPDVYVRTLPLPRTVRNISITHVDVSRSVVGTDRPVGINVTVKNTGTEPVSAANVLLLSDGKVIEQRPYARLDAGQTASLSFTHQFKKPGAKMLEARISDADADDLPDDNSRLCAVRVLNRLPVLIVNGNPATEFLQQASAYVQLALAPDEGADSSESEEPAYRPLVDTVIKDANNVADEKDFSDFRVIILADVPRLSDSVAQRIAQFVNGGGGLLIAPGSQAMPDFYNHWRRADGSGNLLPALLGERWTVQAGAEPMHVAPTTFTHPALASLAAAMPSDLGTVFFRSFWKLKSKSAGELASGGRFASGDPLLTEAQVGAGKVVLLAASLDTSDGNLAPRASFLVLMHELIYNLADMNRGGGLTLEAGKEGLVSLSAETGHPLAFHSWQPGLQAEFFATADLTPPAAVRRVDEKIDFDWAQASPVEKVPSDKFAVRWTGVIVPPESQTYTFILSGQGKAQFWFDGKQIINRGGAGSAEASEAMKANERHELKIEEIKTAASAGVKLEWQHPGQPRQVVPASAFFHSAEEVRGGDAEAFVVTTPGGKQLHVPGETHQGAVSLKLPPSDTAALGVYYAQPPDSLKKLLSSTEDEQGRIPIAVTANPQSSELAALGKDDWKMLRGMGGLHLLDNADAVRALALNKAFGPELWSYLAMAALVILIAEIALTRWIAIQRQATTAPVSEFEYHTRAAHHALGQRTADKRVTGQSAAERFANPQKTFSL